MRPLKNFGVFYSTLQCKGSTPTNICLDVITLLLGVYLGKLPLCWVPLAVVCVVRQNRMHMQQKWFCSFFLREEKWFCSYYQKKL